MKTTTKTFKEVTLALNQEEALWLMLFVRNPLVPPEEEEAHEKANRRALYDSLQASLREEGTC